MEPSRGVGARLARALGAYIQATPAKELPTPLKRWRKFRPRALAGRAADVIDVLDDAAVRALVKEWLAEKPSLPKADADLLKAAVDGGQGWRAEAEKVGAAKRTPKRARQDPTRHLEDRLEKERNRTIAAKEELRRARADAAAAVSDERRRAREADAELAELRRELERTRSALLKAESEADRQSELRQREARRHRTALDKARSETEGVRSRLKDVRSEAAELRRQIRQMERELAAARRPPATSPRGKARGPRTPLKVPKGRLADAPETLEAWLKRNDVRLLIDGYNVTKSQEGFPGLSLSAQRERLVDATQRLARRFGFEATVVFDGADVPVGTKRRTRAGVTTEYSRAGQTADDHLIDLLEGLGPTPVVVVTSDKELQGRAGKLGATIARSSQFLELIRSGRHSS